MAAEKYSVTNLWILPVERLFKNIAVGCWRIAIGETISLVLDTKHQHFACAGVLESSLASRRNAHYATLGYRKGHAVNLIFTFALENEIEFLVGLVSVKESTILPWDQCLE